jgi:hypothetical protein
MRVADNVVSMHVLIFFAISHVINWAGFGGHGKPVGSNEAPGVPHPNSDVTLKVPAGETRWKRAQTMWKNHLMGGSRCCLRSHDARRRTVVYSSSVNHRAREAQVGRSLAMSVAVGIGSAACHDAV